MTDPEVAADAPDPRTNARRFGVAFAFAFAAVALAYLAVAIPGRWFPRADTLGWSAPQLALVRGSGGLAGGELVVTASGADGTVLVSVETDFRADHYPGLAWAAIDLPESGDVRLLWRNDVAPSRVNSVPLVVEAGRPRTAVVADHPAWIGRVKGIALLVTRPIEEPLRFRGVAAKPMGALDILRDRAAEWFAFEPWTGQSIDSVTGGADLQDLPLPVVIAAVTALALVLMLARAAIARRAFAFLPSALIAAFALGWLVVDIRATTNLARQVTATAARYGGLDWRERRLAAEDGELFAFIERARAALPPAPARVFVAAETHYHRGRAAYHLYPHNVFHDPQRDTLPRAEQMRADDWVLVYRRRGVQYDPAAKRLRWDGGAPIAAELVLTGDRSALFRVLPTG